MRRLSLWVSVLLSLTMAVLTGCKEDIDTSARYVFKDYTVASYLEAHEQFSQYVELLKQQPVNDMSETTVYQLLTAYGQYTCFAPTNDAIHDYLNALVEKGIAKEPNWDGFPNDKVRDSIKSVIVMNSLLDGTKADMIYAVGMFPTKTNEEFALSTMGDCRISVYYNPKDPDQIAIDSICPIDQKNRDIMCLNGIIHQLSYPINPSSETLGSKLHVLATQPDCGYFVMANLIEACGLVDTLSAVKDYEWERLVKIGQITKSHWDNLNVDVNPPEQRKYGFTLFAETDEFWSNTLGKPVADITVNDIRNWVAEQKFYPTAVNDDNFTSEDNLLYQFVTYHILPMRLPKDKLVLHYNENGYVRNPKTIGVPAWAHYVTMGKRRLLRLWESRESNGVYLNRFPQLYNGRHENYHEVEPIDPEDEGILVKTGDDDNMLRLYNSIIYPIDKLLVYDMPTRQKLMHNRLRYDVYDFMPECMSNDMRVMPAFERFYFPADEIYQYFKDFNVNSKDMTFYLLNGINQNWPNYQADEVLCEGMYDVTLRLPPVPLTGTYEIRMGVSTESPWRGICQVYFGENKDALYPAGIPVNMALGGNDPQNRLGWESDGDDDDYNAEVDKRMRNNGFMKGPQYFVQNPGGTETARKLQKTTRRILIRTTMDADKVYYMRFKTVQDQRNKQLFLDYLEWCPKEIYDNPETPEDVW